MATEPRYQQLFEVISITRGEGRELASALSDPYTVIHDIKNNEFYIAWDADREAEMGDDELRVSIASDGSVTRPEPEPDTDDHKEDE